MKNNAELLGDILEIWKGEVDPILDIANFLPTLAVQPLQLAVISHFSKNGGNALGIDESDGPLASRFTITTCLTTDADL